MVRAPGTRTIPQKAETRAGGALPRPVRHADAAGGEDGARRRAQERTAPQKAPLLPLSEVPTHVAIIMDGNGRWARQRGLPRMAGHRAGTESIGAVIERFADYGVQCLTLYAFSTENWARPKAEVSRLMRILSHVIKRETSNFHKEGIRLRHIGRL